MYLPTTTGPTVYHSLSPDKRKLFCLFICHNTLSYYGVSVFSLPIPHGMHLVVLAQLCPFGWYVIPTGHFPQKSLSRNLKIGFPLSPPLNHALLPLTHDLTVSCTGWVQAGEVWALRLPLFHVCPKSACCLCICRPFLTIFWFPFPLWLTLFVAGPCLMVGFAFSSAHSSSCYYLLPYHSIISAAKLFCFNLAGPLWVCHLFFP